MKKNQKDCKAVLLFICFIYIIAAVKGQSYEIRAVNKGMGIIGVQMRRTGDPAPTTADYITDIIFGIKWSSAYNVDLTNSITTSYNIQKAGAQSAKNGFSFQSFYAEPVGFNIPGNWGANNWVEILSIPNSKSGSGTGTFEIAEQGFDPTTDPNIGINFIDSTPVINGSATEVILPVTLGSFQVTSLTRQVQLSWKGSNEQSSKGFEVQRSDVVPDNFKKIGWVNSKVNSDISIEYAFTDANVSANVKYFYRLLQVEIDGHYKFSEIKTAVIGGSNDKGIQIMPNPVSSVLKVYFDNNALKGTVTMKVVDVKGAVIISRHQGAQGNANTEINISGLTGGQYYLVIEKDKEVIYSKAFLKSN